MHKELATLHTKEDFERFSVKVSAVLGKSEQTVLKKVERFFDNPHNWDNPINEYVFRTWLLPNIPRFLYYDECFMLPSEICLEQLENRSQTPDGQTVCAFLALTGLDVKAILNAEEFGPSFQADLEIAQAELSDSFLQVWTGNSDLRIELGLVTKYRDSPTEKGAVPQESPSCI